MIMTTPEKYSFTRYLAAKKSVDDRALNRQVWQALVEQIPTSSPVAPLRVLEIGAGIGTMIERVWDWQLLTFSSYTALDAEMESVMVAWERLERWARQRPDIRDILSGEDLVIHGDSCAMEIRFLAGDLFDFIAIQPEPYDLLIANAFLDLVDIPAMLPKLFRLLKPGGLFYFSINFDGLTLFEPEIDPEFDAQVQALYHRTMDERIVDGKPSGDSRVGRHLFGLLQANGAEILQAGASDWVVFPGRAGYPEDEAYFLHFIIHTLHQALHAHPELDQQRFEQWIALRHAQVDRAELLYIAHQVDFAGRLR